MTAARVARIAATAAADCCGSGRPTRIGVAVVRVARMPATVGPPGGGQWGRGRGGQGKDHRAAWRSTGLCAGTASPAAVACSIHIDESGIHTVGARTAAGHEVRGIDRGDGHRRTRRRSPRVDVPGIDQRSDGRAMSGAAATVSEPPGTGRPAAFRCPPVCDGCGGDRGPGRRCRCAAGRRRPGGPGVAGVAAAVGTRGRTRSDEPGDHPGRGHDRDHQRQDDPGPVAGRCPAASR